MWIALDAFDERIAFKRLTAGYLFRAPSRWFFGRPQHYTVDELQKDRIAGRLAQIRLRRADAFIVVIVAMLLGLMLSVAFPDYLLLGSVCAAVLLVALIALTRFRQVSALQSVLSDVPQTGEQITWRDRIVAAGAASSTSQPLVLGISFAVICLAMALRLGGYLNATNDGHHLLRLIVTAMAVVFFGSLAAANLGMTVLQARLRKPER